MARHRPLTTATIEPRKALCYHRSLVRKTSAGKSTKVAAKSTAGKSTAKASTAKAGRSAKPASAKPASKGKAGKAAAGSTKKAVADRGKPKRLPPAGGEAPKSQPRDVARRKAAQQLAEAAISAALDKKALAPILLDVSDHASYTDFIGVVSGRSDRQVVAIAENVESEMKKLGRTLMGREGKAGGRWSLLDFGDFILHVFYHPVREVYDIEGLWIEAKRVALKNVPPEAMQFQTDAMY